MTIQNPPGRLFVPSPEKLTAMVDSAMAKCDADFNASLAQDRFESACAHNHRVAREHAEAATLPVEPRKHRPDPRPVDHSHERDADHLHTPGIENAAEELGLEVEETLV